MLPAGRHWELFHGPFPVGVFSPPMLIELREYGRAVVKHLFALLGGGVLGAVGIASLRWQFHIPSWIWFVGAGLAFFWVQFGAWRDMRDQRDAALLESEASQQPVLVGGAGGSGFAAGGGLVIGGSGGGVAYGEGAVAEGGGPGKSAFEMLARSSLDMGYPLADFIRLAGFDPHSDELDRIGVGGDSGGVTEGGSGLIVVQAKDGDGRTIQVDVMSEKGHSTIRPKDQP